VTSATTGSSSTRTVPGTFSRIAGVLSLHGLDVLAAQAHSDEPQPDARAMAASQFRVVVPRRTASTGRRSASTCAGRCAVDWRSRPGSPNGPAPTVAGAVTQAASPAAAGRVPRRRVEQRDRDRGAMHQPKIGILHRITKALAEVGLDIRHATVQTIGMEVVDTFYVRDWTGGWSPTRSTAPRSSGPSSTP
jgi:[protein-PII] uridylyltransferase